MNTGQDKAIIVGATSGIGREVAMQLLNEGWTLGICGRREERLEEIRMQYPGKVFTQVLDITSDDAPTKLMGLVERMGGINLYFHVSGIGFMNKELDTGKEARTADTNVKGFTQMMDTMFRYFEDNPGIRGHMACVSSIAGTKGLGAAPAYSASKRYCSNYMEALEQLARMKGMKTSFTDIRPGFVDTDLLNGDYKYPMMMDPKKVAATIVKSLKRKKRVVIINWKYRIVVFLWRLIPRCIWVRMRV